MVIDENICAMDHGTARIPFDPHRTLKSVLSKNKIPVVNFHLAQLHPPHGGSMTFWGIQCCFEKLVSEAKAEEVSWHLVFLFSRWASAWMLLSVPPDSWGFHMERLSDSVRAKSHSLALFLELSLFSGWGRPAVSSQVSVLMVGSSPMPCFSVARYSYQLLVERDWPNLFERATWSALSLWTSKYKNVHTPDPGNFFLEI